MSDLLPCPFCGESAEIVRVGDRRASTQYACQFCGCFLETGEEWGHGKSWNTRSITAALALPEIEALVDALEFYAVSHSKNPNEGPWGMSSTDYGLRARVAVAAMKGKANEIGHN